jgi:hypothetical protein
MTCCLSIASQIVHMELASGDRFGDVALRGESEPALALPAAKPLGLPPAILL